jgi:hypothetical protein
MPGSTAESPVFGVMRPVLKSFSTVELELNCVDSTAS